MSGFLEVDVSSERASRLESAVVAVCSEVYHALSARNHAKTLPELEITLGACISDLVNDTLRGFMHRLSHADNSARLPTELLTQIFDNLNLKDRVSTSHVCWRWRKISLASTSRLWTNIVVLNDMRTGILDAMLERSQQFPVSVEVEVTPRNVVELADCLIHHMHHIRRLSVDVKHMLSSDEDRLLTNALHTAAPLLERFLLYDPSNAFVYHSTASLFAAQAHNLRVVKFQGEHEHFSQEAASLRAVRRLIYSKSVWNLQEDLFSIFQLFTGLEEICIDLDDLEGIGRGCLICPSSLRTFAIITRVSDFDPSATFLSAEATSSLRHLAVSFSGFLPKPDIGITLLASFLSSRSTIKSLTLMSMHDDELSATAHARDSSDRRCTLINIPVPVNGHWLPGMIEKLTFLSLSEVLWTLILPLPPLLVLEEIEIRVLLPKAMSNHSHNSVFMVSSSDPAYTLRCPSLRTLAITGRPFADPLVFNGTMVLAPDVLEEFVDRRLSFGVRKLQLLCMRGTRILQNSVDATARLLSLFEDISVEDGCSLPTTDLEDLMTWT